MTKSRYLKKLESYEQIREVYGVLIVRVLVTNTGKYEIAYQPTDVKYENGRSSGRIKLYGNDYYAQYIDGIWRVNTKYGLCRI